ncbi:MAG: GGDEF domain-containing protein [Rhizobacter sp.]|nr:GGDEF domain-containing protein [Rhizobacter sp.]
MARHTGRSYWQALTRAALAAALVHLAFSAVFFALHAPLMAWANLGSIGKLLLGVLLAGFYIGLDAYSRLQPPVSPIAADALDLVRYFNIAATLALLAYLAHYYFGAVLRAERRLHNLATTDSLTGLANRRRVMQVAAQQLGRRRRDGTPLSFMLGDVDHFKAVNDRHGHDTGDRVLIKVAGTLKAATREADTVSRWCGEEFLVVLPETDLATALKVAERVRESVRQVVVMRGSQAVNVTITLGVSSLRGGESLDDAIARADAAMYQGKVDGRNRSVAETLH